MDEKKPISIVDGNQPTEEIKLQPKLNTAMPKPAPAAAPAPAPAPAPAESPAADDGAGDDPAKPAEATAAQPKTLSKGPLPKGKGLPTKGKSGIKRGPGGSIGKSAVKGKAGIAAKPSAEKTGIKGDVKAGARSAAGARAPVAKAQAKSCVWANILLIFSLFISIFAVIVLFLNLTEETVMGGLREPVNNLGETCGGIALGPEENPAQVENVNGIVEKVSAAAKSASDVAERTQAFLLQDG
jgi:hypothetical protein